VPDPVHASSGYTSVVHFQRVPSTRCDARQINLVFLSTSNDDNVHGSTSGAPPEPFRPRTPAPDLHDSGERNSLFG